LSLLNFNPELLKILTAVVFQVRRSSGKRRGNSGWRGHHLSSLGQGRAMATGLFP
jgi:hypothetical protein